jgi:hypothetical protein
VAENFWRSCSRSAASNRGWFHHEPVNCRFTAGTQPNRPLENGGLMANGSGLMDKTGSFSHLP